jgi:uncharacterized zinc-type alcohol dehydrogenase-like protein
METILGYAAMERGGELVPLRYLPPALKGNDVRVSITHCGLCHTDINAIKDHYGITKYPIVPGHEIVGTVSEIGPSVKGLQEGDRVGIGWQGRSCKKCEWCRQGEEQLCQEIVKDATWSPYGGFSSSVAVDERFAYKLPDGLPSESASVLMCAGVAVYSPLRSFLGHSSKKIGVVGVGGLGHLAIQFAHAMGYDVTALSSSPGKMDDALAFGADRFMDISDEKEIQRHEYEFDMLLCTADGQLRWEPLLSALKKRGIIVLAGFPRLALNTTDLVAHELSITGSFLGNRATMQEMLPFAYEHNIAPLIELMPMKQVNEAMRKLVENKARYRIVLVNDH